MDKVSQVLENLGFEEREIKIYLTLISEQNTTALQISKKTGIDRTTTYDILERLMNKGIVSSFTQNKVKHFKALDPKRLGIYFKEKYNSLENILPLLNQISKQRKELVKCELFQGKNGFKIVLRDFLEAKADYKVIGLRKDYEEILGYITDQWIMELNKLNIKETAIAERGSKFIKTRRGVYRYLDKDQLPPITTLIYNNVVVFFIWKEPYFVIRIENSDFAKIQEEYFDMLWKIAKPK